MADTISEWGTANATLVDPYSVSGWGTANASLENPAGSLSPYWGMLNVMNGLQLEPGFGTSDFGESPFGQ